MSLINYLKIELDNSSALRAILPLHSMGSRHSLLFPDKAPLHPSNITLAFSSVTGLFLSNENTIGPAVDLLGLVVREASRDRR